MLAGSLVTIRPICVVMLSSAAPIFSQQKPQPAEVMVYQRERVQGPEGAAPMPHPGEDSFFLWGPNPPEDFVRNYEIET